MSPDTTHIHASFSDTIQGEVIAKVTQLGGVITSIEQVSSSRTAIGSTFPKKHIDEFKMWLHTFSDGQESFSEDHT